MRAMYNTFDECSDSFLKVKFLNSHMEFPCTPEILTIGEKGKIPYIQQYVHTCKIYLDSSQEVHEFTYMISGGQGKKSEDSEWKPVELPYVKLVWISRSCQWL